MQIKWIGAAFVILSCGGFGFSIACKHRREEAVLHSFLRMLRSMQWELQYRLTPLPELCRLAAKEVSGALKDTLICMAEELERQILPDAASCMRTAIQKNDHLPVRLANLLRLLGQSLGRYDLAAQIQGMEAVQIACVRELESLGENRDVRLRSYQTLGLCAGAALVILFI